ncbi:FliA/WhiG family RNA polymerase sigma factor [Neobacillus sp. NPDC093127]|uniref:FliA/WhiG family RNA polymerase sigma factor n=1 Tax=Neobacillus sp. NPDC093127 TaxID=3364296 RepID=UPI0037FD9C9E
MEEMLDKYIPLVKMVVAQMKKKLSDQADEGELFSSGMVGLWDASLKFDTKQGVKFETYAVQRIRGAILDGIRQTDHASRSLRKKEKLIREALETLEQVLLRKPSAEEMSKYLGMPAAEYEQTLIQISSIKQDSLDEPMADDGIEAPSYHQIEDHYFQKQEEWIEAKERKQQLAALIDSLPDREKLVLSLVYYENLSLTDVSKVLDVHKSRISQLHSQAIKRLRGAAEKQGFSL